MDRRSWLWRRKSSEKSPGETESSGSVSSISGRLSDDQEVSRASPNNASPSHSQSPEVTSSSPVPEVHATVKSLAEKLSAALLTISAKEDLVKQHMKVAEEAIAGWEKSETELASLKRLLEATAQKNSALEDRVGHLDGALKESVRQFRQSREEQEQKIHDVLMKKTREWDSNKFEFENRITELQVQLEAAKAEAAASINRGFQSKVEATEKENLSLKAELLARTEDLRTRALEKEIITRAAESASKQHLESMKKVSKLEAECRRLKTFARKNSLANDQKHITNLVSTESVTDSQSDSGERFVSMDNGPSYLDSWASTLVTERDQLKTEKVNEKETASSVKIGLMDDFLEMERIATMPESYHGSSTSEFETDGTSKIDQGSIRRNMAKLEDKLAKTETEKAELEMVLTDTRNRLEFSLSQLVVAEDKLTVLQRHLESANESKIDAMTEILAADEKRKAMDSQLELAQAEARMLHQKVYTLQGQVEKDKTLSNGFAAKLESAESRKKALEYQLATANFEVKKLRNKACMLEVQVEEEKAVSSEQRAKAETLTTERKNLECQLESAHLEAKRLNEKVDLLQTEAREEKSKSVISASRLAASEAKRKVTECEFESANFEIGKLHEKVKFLEARVAEEMSLSAALSVKFDATEAAKTALEVQLKLVQSEVEELHDKVGLLGERVVDENVSTSTATSAAKNYDSEGGLLLKKQEAVIQFLASSNREFNTKQDIDMATAAGKLSDCQMTIASISRQLKSLASLDDVMLEIEKVY